MQFDPNNPIIQLCVEGMRLEGEGKTAEASELFQRAWEESSNDFEKFTSAHYVARHQQSVEDKLKWDEIALISALKIHDESMQANYPSLYLNVAKGYEDLQDFDQAIKNYHLAQSFIHFLPDDGYGQLVKNGIANGIIRVTV
ncbi:hypothetical protein [Haliscomenobacter hydrossis]|uniref:Rifampin ADP-ribosyl transferase n=1 Tax=Haliscomenobacter hydrossis (strain ATCC 27775 / DSM 1100 / LMG 10767 / O) TaxID=760192 RepID=F4L2P5_HALH1|nr:hypothetical protein [Haliscomenobacter hydrossis]AEE48609.1 rifampin ADP-ribosyl transferase [Haliscomenobacter hydrossis DSM 1100]